MEKFLIFGHKSPDTDSIASSIAMEYIKKQMNEDAKAYRLGEINNETKYALDYFKFNVPELLENVTSDDHVILVDHNEFTQSANGIEEACIDMVIDHHRIYNFQTSAPLFYMAEPVGCTCTILYELCIMNNITLTREIAGLMLSAIISDTLLFKSPTCTVKDEKVANELAKIANVDINTYGLELLKAGTDLSSYSAKELINIDSKLVSINNVNIQIAQVNTVDINDVLKNKSEIEDAMNLEIKNNNLGLFMFLITDILNCNSQVIALGNRCDVVEKSYNVTLENNSAFLEGVVSRKKQVIPIISENI